MVKKNEKKEKTNIKYV